MPRVPHTLEVQTGEIDVFESLRWHRLGSSDATTQRSELSFTKAFRVGKNTARVHLEKTTRETHMVTIHAEEEDLGPLLDQVPALLGASDTTHASFEPGPRVLRDVRLRGRRVRLVRVPWLYESLVGIVLQQRVAYVDAARSHQWLVREFGERSDEDGTLRVFPSPQTLMRIPPEAFRQAGVDHERAERLRNVGRTAHHLPKLLNLNFEDARALLSKIRGLGPWTVENLMGSALGDADALPTGDYWLPHTVAYGLAGEPRADDARMIELMEPLRPHRYRALLWLTLAGVKPVRYGPRMPRSGPTS